MTKAKSPKNLETYVQCDVSRVTDWLRAVAGPISFSEQAGDAVLYDTRFGTVIITPGVDNGRFVGVYFCEGNRTPWTTDTACSRQISKELGCLAQCDPGAEFPDVHPASDIFLEIEGDTERLIFSYTSEDGETTMSALFREVTNRATGRAP